MSYEVGNKKPPKDKQFKKGQSGNLLGGKLHDPVKRAIKKLTSAEVEKVITMMLEKNKGSILEVGKNPESSVLELMVASIASRAVTKGDHKALDALLDRTIGKVKEKLEFQGTIEQDVKIEDKERIRQIRKAIHEDV